MSSFEENLISLVREHEFLYITRSRSYKSLIRRDRAWAKIAAELSKPIAECKQRWKSLRDRFVREKKKMEQRSDSTATEESEQWELYSSMEFLNEAMIPRKQISGLELSSSPLLDDSSRTQLDLLSPKQDTFFTFTDTSTTSDIENLTKRQRSSEFPTKELFLNSSQTEEPDENDLFMKMIAKKMKLLPQAIKMRLQEKILNDVNKELMKFL